MIEYDIIKLNELANEYMSIKLDILFSNFFDFKSTNNIDLKIEILEWAIKNDKTIYFHERYEEEKILEKYPKSKIWDISNNITL